MGLINNEKHLSIIETNCIGSYDVDITHEKISKEINIQDMVGDILNKFGNTEMGRYKIQLLFDEIIRLNYERNTIWYR